MLRLRRKPPAANTKRGGKRASEKKGGAKEPPPLPGAGCKPPVNRQRQGGRPIRQTAAKKEASCKAPTVKEVAGKVAGGKKK